MLTHLLLALAAVPATPSGPEAVDAFAAVCQPVAGIEQLRQRAAATGWNAYEPTADDGVYRLLSLGRAALAFGDGAIDVFRNEAAHGLTLMLVLAEGEDVAVTACRLYGDTSAAPPRAEDLARRMGRSPSRHAAEHGLTTSAWEPGWARGDDSLELMVVARDSAAAKALAFAGWALVARSVRATGKAGE